MPARFVVTVMVLPSPSQHRISYGAQLRAGGTIEPSGARLLIRFIHVQHFMQVHFFNLRHSFF